MIARFLSVLMVLAPVTLAKESAREKIPTFNRDIAPIVFGQCVECHHPGGTAPFSLANYADVKKRAKLIARVVGTKYMPPWMPEPGHGDFVGARLLTDAQIALIDRWAKAGTVEGPAADLQVKPQWKKDWQLGTPDLVVTLPVAYTLPADGKDVYRNFVIPDVVPEDRYLRASEFNPGATGAIHHAFVLLDDEGGAQRRATRESEPGFPGMDTAGAGASDAMFMGWQPGKRPAEAPPGLAAVLRKGTDLVLQLHMRPTGKIEKIQPSVALYFSDKPPTRSAMLIALRVVDIDIAPGLDNYSIETSYELPVDVELLAISPHLHYLGKEVRGWADLPDGSRRDLILIKKWDFNWQGDYRYSTPVLLPMGSRLHARFTYDNSASNERNPNQPPRRVTYGLQSSDEMGELWFQILPRNSDELDTLKRDCVKNLGLPDAIAWANAMLRNDPKDAVSRAKLGAALAVAGRMVEASRALKQAIVDDPNLARAHYVLGQIYCKQQNWPEARKVLERTVELEPENGRAQNDLGSVLLTVGEVQKAIPHFEKAVQVMPRDPLAQQNLAKAQAIAREQSAAGSAP